MEKNENLINSHLKHETYNNTFSEQKKKTHDDGDDKSVQQNLLTTESCYICSLQKIFIMGFDQKQTN